MNKLIILLVSVFASVLVNAQIKPNQSGSVQNPVTFPTTTAPTIPSDAMFALGQQSIQLQSISIRLDKMEPDISSLKHDVDKLLIVYDVVVYSTGLIFSIVASYVIVRVIRRVWPEPPSPPSAIAV
jgi:hypothetical protein